MPSPGGIALGIVKGLESTIGTIKKVEEYKTKLNREQEKFDLDKKIAELSIKKMEGEVDPAILDLRRKQLKSEAEYKQAALNLENIKAENALSEERRKAKQFETEMQWLKDYGVYPGKGTGGPTNQQVYNAARNLAKSTKANPFQEPTADEIQKYMGDARNLLVNQGSGQQPGGKGDAEPNGYPIGMPGGDTIYLPKSVETTSQAVSYLMENKGLSRDQAIDVLRNQNQYNNAVLKARPRYTIKRRYTGD